MHLGKGALRVRSSRIKVSALMVRLPLGLGYNIYEDQGIFGQGGIRGRL